MKQKEGQIPELPDSFRSILWSYRFERIDPQKHKKIIVTQAINYGNLDHWRWILRTYGKDEVRRIIRELPATSFRARVLKLVSLLLEIAPASLNHAQRGTH